MNTPRKNQALPGMDRALEAFVRHAPAFGVAPNPLQIDQVRTYVAELLRWNEKINLTGAKQPEEVLLRHVLDSVAVVPHLESTESLLDVGSGGGLPGIPIKLFRPRLLVVLLEARRKKVSFNQHVVGRLALEGVEAVWGRLGEGKIRERYAHRPFDAIITRAALSGREFLQRATPLLRPAGRILLMMGTIDRGKRKELEEEALKQGRRVVQVAPYRLPGRDRTRNLVLIG